MNIQWYPGHMTKARRMMQENIKLIDLVIELADARLPLSSRNPDIDDMARGKARMILLTKADMADPKVNDLWEKWFSEKGYFVKQIDSRKKNDVKAITPVIVQACQEKIERDRRRGIKNRPVRAMIAGIPNVGKSTFINSYAGRASAKTGNKPGVTRGAQWIKAAKNVEMLDTPGLLWPKFDDQLTGIKLAAAGSISDDVLDITDLSLWLIDYLHRNYPQAAADRYGVDTGQEDKALLLADIAVNRKCITKGGEPDLTRAARLVLDDFRSGRLGRISLERPGEES